MLWVCLLMDVFLIISMKFLGVVFSMLRVLVVILLSMGWLGRLKLLMMLLLDRLLWLVLWWLLILFRVMFMLEKVNRFSSGCVGLVWLRLVLVVV